AGHDLGDRVLDGRRRAAAAERDEERDVVRRVSGLELVEEPEAALGERGRQQAVARDGLERRPVAVPVATGGVVDERGELRDRPVLEGVAERERGREGALEPGQ